MTALIRIEAPHFVAAVEIAYKKSNDPPSRVVIAAAPILKYMRWWTEARCSTIARARAGLLCCWTHPMSKRISKYPVREFSFSPEPGFDRSTWGDGPWTGEPDKVQWVDPITDLDCLIHRSPVTGSLCGYVGVAEGHPCFEVSYSEHPAEQLSAHGGLTFANFCQECDPKHPHMGICHDAYDGRPERVWWLGFDCALLWTSRPPFDYTYAAV